MQNFDKYELPRTTKVWLNGSPFASTAQAMVFDLELNSYTCKTICCYLSCVAHFAHWCEAEAIDVGEIDTNKIDQFIYKHLPQCTCASRCRVSLKEVRAALNQWEISASRIGVFCSLPTGHLRHIKSELEDFSNHLKDVKGLQSITIETQQKYVAAFLEAYFGQRRTIQIHKITPQNIHNYISTQTSGWKPSSIKVLCVALRSYLRFKSINGKSTQTLIAALPSTASWRQTTLPKALEHSEIETLLAAFDQATLGGQRDYAIARCYIDLGLRTAEILRLTLDDILWAEAKVQIRGKGRRVDALPLPAETGDAIARYLKNRDVKNSSRSLFHRLNAPFEKPVGTDMIRGSIRNAASRCGLSHKLTGPHRFRHTLAIRLVQSGTSLKVISDVLRHRDLDTTTIYAKTDLESLSEVAGRWPGESS
ncbi:site-specific integrase [Granulosicoccus sp.]|nr:site-specific integrase [Granulosicoccus sp.]MDB4224547.1 site-specific integrase [Granulosicoccus sp.]